MSKITSKARQVRLDYQQRMGRTVSIQEVADAIGITRAALSNIENSKTKQVEYETLRKLCEFYGVSVGDLLVYEDRRTLVFAASQHDTNTRVWDEAAHQVATGVPTSPLV